MAFTQALFYPFIDITDEGWLKSALLYWDKIYTIVPESVEHPYTTQTGKILQNANCLMPLRVNSEIEEIKNLSRDVIKYINSEEGAQYLVSEGNSKGYILYGERTESTLDRFTYIHPDKLSADIKYRLNNTSDKNYGNENGWYTTTNQFANFYMTLLATRLSERLGFGLLSHELIADRLAIATRLDAEMSGTIATMRRRWNEYAAFGERRMAPEYLAQGMLVNMILEKVKIDPETPVDKILGFRETHSDELGKFRMEIDSLTQVVKEEMPMQAMHQKLADICLNKIVPTTESLKRGLTGTGIKWATENFLKVALLSTTATSVMTTLGLSVPQALFVGAGISLASSGVLYNLERKKSLDDNPYAYMLSVNKHFNRGV